MRTRNSGTPKAEAPPKKTPPSRRSSRTPKNPPLETAVTPATAEKSGKLGACFDLSYLDEHANPPDDIVEVTPETKVTRGAKTRSSTRKAPARSKTPASGRAASRKTPKSEVIEQPKVEISTEKGEVGESGDNRDGESAKTDETCETSAEKSMAIIEPEKREVGDHEDGESAKKEKMLETIIGESRAKIEPGKEEFEDHGDGESSGKEETWDTIADESKTEVEPKMEEIGDYRGGGSDKEEKTSETIAEEHVTRVGPVMENVEQLSEVEEKICNVEHPPVLDIGISSLQEGDTPEIRDEETTTDLEEEDKTVEPEQEVKDIETKQPLEQNIMDVEEPSEIEEKTLEKEDDLNQRDVNPEELSKVDEKTMDIEQPLAQNYEVVTSQEEPIAVDGGESSESQRLVVGKEGEKVKEEMDEMRTMVDQVGAENEPANVENAAIEEDVNQAPMVKDPQGGNGSPNKDTLVKSGNKGVLEESKEEENAGDDKQEHEVAVDTLEDEGAELTAAAKERKIRKELEIFVGGLDHDVGEEDVKKAFENIGQVVEVRLHKDSSNKDNGQAFVKFATKEQSSQALSEMKNPLIRGKRCWTAPSDDNDMLYLGNICNTWTKEAIKQKLKDYGIESVENITLVPDARHEGLSRGFAFLEFPCHTEAMRAYKRLQKPDVIFGHTERTAKVAFAEPIREPDPEVMAQVKSVFVDGLPPQWNEDKVREKLKGYGEIVRIMLARNLSHAKRRDYGFVDFTTHEAAVACIEGINSKDFGEGISKGKVRARLSNPLPKSQAVKGGMCGGFRIGSSFNSSSSRSGRGFGRGGHAFNRQNIQRDRGFFQRGRGQTGRIGFTREHDVHMHYPPFQQREMFGRGTWRYPFGAAHSPFAGGAPPLRPDLDMIRHDVPDRGHMRHIPNGRFQFPPEEGYVRPVLGRHIDDPYNYDGAHGIKRPFSMTDQEPDYVEHSRLRPRMDYSDPTVSYRGPGYRDSYGAGSNLHSHDYYGSNHGDGQHSASYGNSRPYGRGYYY